MTLEGAFKGVKVVDFGSVLAGPLVSKLLADHGATVVWVESIKKPDLSRVSSPFKDGIPGVDRAGPTHGFIRQGDIIVEVNRTPVRSLKDFQRALGKSRKVLLLIQRGSSQLFMVIQR